VCYNFFIMNDQAPTKHADEIVIHHKRGRLSYKTTIRRHLLTIVLVTVCFAAIGLLALHFAYPHNAFSINDVSFEVILVATLNSFARLLVAYICAVIISIPLALFIVSTPSVQRITLPIADVAQSVPVLAFFPVVVAVFISSGRFEIAAIFILVTVMIWNMVFPAIQGLQTIPADIESAAIVFNVKGFFKKLWNITLPSIFPFLVIGSLEAWGQGWTTLIVAEVLHTYIPNGTVSQDLLGLGSLLVDSSVASKTAIFVVTLTVMILFISLLNLFVWQKLIRLSQHFKFD
jgi:NitT/TauT family transport system permease protein